MPILSAALRAVQILGCLLIYYAAFYSGFFREQVWVKHHIAHNSHLHANECMFFYKVLAHNVNHQHIVPQFTSWDTENNRSDTSQSTKRWNYASHEHFTTLYASKQACRGYLVNLHSSISRVMPVCGSLDAWSCFLTTASHYRKTVLMSKII